jgi:hypothetical protein
MVVRVRMGLSGILPNGNSIAVLNKRFEFENAEDLKGFLADLSGYEEKKHWQTRSRSISTFHLSCPLPDETVRLPIANVLNGFQHQAKMNVFGDQYMPSSSASERTSLEGQMGKRRIKDEKTQRVTDCARYSARECS